LPPDTPGGRRQELSRAAAIEGFVAGFRSSIARRAPRGRYVVPLSGGRDSRHILFELRAQGFLDPECITARAPLASEDSDTVIARMLAHRIGIPHTIVEPPSSIEAERRKNLETQFESLEHRWYLGIADRMGSADAVYDGLGCDVLTDIRGEGGRTEEASQQLEGGRCRDLAVGMLLHPGRAFRKVFSPSLSSASTASTTDSARQSLETRTRGN
jgi:hypothetical protein